MDDTEAESCGRCAMTGVVEMTTEDGSQESRPFDSARIELDSEQLRAASLPMVLAGRVKRRVDEFAFGLIYGR